MKLRPKTKAVGQGRNRQKPDSTDLPPKSASRSTYNSRRIDAMQNVGRNDGREKKALKRLKAWTWVEKLILLVIGLVIVGFLVKIYSLSSKPEIVIVNKQAVSAAYPPNIATQYAQTASQFLSSSAWNTNKITIDNNGIKRALLDKYPQLVAVDVSVPLFNHNPIIYVEQSEPSLVIEEANGTYLLDSNGRAMFKSTNLTGLNTSNLPVVKDLSNLNIGVGDQVLPSTDISFIHTVLAELAAKGYNPSYLNLPAASSELDVGIDGQPYYVKFNLASNDPRMQAGTFLATIYNLKQQNITPTKYIDVRVDGRSYYI